MYTQTNNYTHTCTHTRKHPLTFSPSAILPLSSHRGLKCSGSKGRYTPGQGGGGQSVSAIRHSNRCSDQSKSTAVVRHGFGKIIRKWEMEGERKRGSKIDEGKNVPLA